MYFLRAVFPFILAKKPRAKLCIVGPNPPRQARELGTGDVTITGYVPDIRPYLARAAVAVCPMRLAVGTQNKIIEAMAMGVPVVSTSPGCTGLEVSAEEHLLVADEPAVFAERVVEVMEDSQLQARLARNGRGYVESHHDWKSIVRQLETIHAQVAGGR
jgi:glycosyltransferase involved in cell wall biosynthesis